MKLTIKGRYILQAMLDLTANANGRAVSVKDISKRQNISLSYLNQLFFRLKKLNIVKSVRGPGGGYVLQRPANEVSVRDILEGVGELVEYSDMVEVSEDSTKEQLMVAGFIQSMDKTLKLTLETKLASLNPNG